MFSWAFTQVRADSNLFAHKCCLGMNSVHLPFLVHCPLINFNKTGLCVRALNSMLNPRGTLWTHYFNVVAGCNLKITKQFFSWRTWMECVLYLRSSNTIICVFLLFEELKFCWAATRSVKINVCMFFKKNMFKVGIAAPSNSEMLWAFQWR